MLACRCLAQTLTFGRRQRVAVRFTSLATALVSEGDPEKACTAWTRSSFYGACELINLMRPRSTHERAAEVYVKQTCQRRIKCELQMAAAEPLRAHAKVQPTPLCGPQLLSADPVAWLLVRLGLQE